MLDDQVFNPGELWILRTNEWSVEDVFVIEDNGLASALGFRGMCGQVRPDWCVEGRRVEIESEYWRDYA